MIHGKTKIELYNPNTKVKTVYRDENVFQSAVIAKYMRSLGRAVDRLNMGDGTTQDRNSAYSWKNLLGGIMLFRDTITEGSQYMPAGNQMVGNGCYNVVNNANPTELGSWNDTESSATASAITQVYDFSTSQANGTISCVCLSSLAGGYIGYGNASQGRATARGYYAGQELEEVGAGHAFKDNTQYLFSYDDTNKELTVTKKYIPITRGFIRAGMSTNVTIDFSSYSMDSAIRWIYQDGDYVYFSYYQAAIATGGTFKYYKYNLTNDTVTEETLTNPLSESLYPTNISGIAHGYLFYFKNTLDKSFIINLSTGVLVKEVDWYIGTATRFTDGLISIADVNSVPWIYNIQNDTILPNNGAFAINYNVGQNLYYDSSCDIMYSRRYNESMLIRNNPLYLATINNLENPVSKTAAQTMKVTYTLTEAE